MNDVNLDINSLFQIAINHLDLVLQEKDLKTEFDQLLGKNYKLDFINKSIDFTLINNNSYLENRYKINIQIINNEIEIANYFLYLDKQKNFLDEFLIINEQKKEL